MKHKYSPQESALRVQVKTSDSFAWKAISGAMLLIREGLAFFIGSGDNTKLWTDPWLKGSPPSRPSGPDLSTEHRVFQPSKLDS
jgi:hypothetical protein